MRIDLALNVLYQRRISSREQLLKEMLRVQMTRKELGNIANNLDKEGLFQLMKRTTEDELGFFPADRDDFSAFFAALQEIDPIDFALEIYRNDRMGMSVSPVCLTQYISQRISQLKPQKILIAEAEKHLSGLRELLEQFRDDAIITLTTQNKTMYNLLQLAFGARQNVSIRLESIYAACLPGGNFDYIFLLPDLTGKPDESSRGFMTRDSDGIAVENMLGHLSERGTLDVIVPAKFTFARMGYEKLRAFIAKNYHVHSVFVMPQGIFRPLTAIRTYFLTITTGSPAELELGTLTLDQKALAVRNKKRVAPEEFLSQEDWRIELLLAEDDENIKRFNSSQIAKVKLKAVAEVFRGKSILKKDTSPGNIFVLNISNIEDGEIDYRDLDTIDEDERKVKSYELITGDVVLSCRGTVIKSAVFKAQDKIVIASANLIVIRPKKTVLGDFIKLFLESPVGMAIINSFQRGTSIMNINYADVVEMEIPLLPADQQQEVVDRYQQELKIYKEAIQKAEARWSHTKDSIYNHLTGEGT